MKAAAGLAYKNIKGRAGRSAALMLLAALMAFTVFVGTVMVASLQNGLKSLTERLGADIMVVPYEAATKSALEDMILQGNTGYFYMAGDVMDKISGMDGIGRISAQYYLASASASCCSIPVQIIGFDPDTDFTITPWIRRSNGGELEYLDVVVGNDLNAFVGDEISFYGVDVRVAAKLDKTGTSYDTAVFTRRDTIQTLIKASLDKKLNEYANINAGNVISCILIDVADGAVVDEVLNDINIHVKAVKAVRTGNMISGISDSLKGISSVARILIIAVWVLLLFIMSIAYVMLINERKREFAVFRVIGGSSGDLATTVLLEGVITCLFGSICGVAAGLIIVVLFSNLIESMIALPFLLPNAGMIAVFAACAVLLSVGVGALSSAAAVRGIVKTDAGLLLRTEN